MGLLRPPEVDRHRRYLAYDRQGALAGEPLRADQRFASDPFRKGRSVRLELVATYLI
jgi:hypothetical protein